MRSGVELVELETLCVLAEELHFGRTAQRMGVSPARVTQLVQRLERRLGGRLADRSSRRVSLTPLGRTLVDGVRPALDDLDRCLRQAATPARAGAVELRVGHIMTVENEPAVAALIEEFGRRHPDITLHRLRMDLFDYVGPLHRGEVDVWLTWWPGPAVPGDPAAGLTCGPVITSRPRVLLVDRSHPLAGRTSIGLDDLVEHPVIEMPRDRGPALFRERWIPRTGPGGGPVARIAPSWSGLSFGELPGVLAASGGGWLTVESILATVAMPESVVAVPVRDATPFLLVPWWRADAEGDAVVAFADTIARG